MNTKRFFWGMVALFFVILIDSVGMALIVPILEPTLLDSTGGLLPGYSEGGLRRLAYGLVMSSFYIFMFVVAPILGDLSDQVGRRKILLCCLVGTGVGYWLTGLGIAKLSLGLVLFGRSLDGLTAGSLPIAQAAAVDFSSNENKARNLSLVMLAAALGFILGPVIAMIFSNSNLVSWFSWSTPLYVAAISSMVNSVLLWFALPEARERVREVKIKWFSGLQRVVQGFQHKGISKLSHSFLWMQLAWAATFQFIVIYLNDRFGFDSESIAVFLIVVGVGFCIAFAALVPPLTKRFRLFKITCLSMLLLAVSILILIFSPSEAWVWGIGFFVSLTMAVGYATFITIFTNQVGEDEKGWIMGLTGSISALAFGVTGIVAGILSSFSSVYPLWLIIFSSLISFSILNKNCKKGIIK